MKQFLLLLSLPFLFANKSTAQVQPAHVVICILENHAYSQIHGNAAAPYLNSLLNDANTAALPYSYALTHPSQPNYLMLFSGNNQGVINDNVPGALPFTTANLGAELTQAGFTFGGYSETMPSVGYTGATSGAYARKHNPWINWQGTATNGIPSSSNMPLISFPTNFNTLPTLSFVIPNQNNDMHSGSIATGDTWVQTHLDSYIQWCKTHNSLFILTFDEDDHSSSNQVFTSFTGEDVKTGNYTQRITHYNVLRTLEDLYQLPHVGFSADSSFIHDIWRTTLPLKLVSFNAINKGYKNVLDWSTAQEINTSSFEVQRSADEKNYVAIGKLQSNGSSGHYFFTDPKPLPKINYYRLRMVDADDKATYSNIKSVNNKPKQTVSLFPNPVKDVLSINTVCNSATKLEFTISTADGRGIIQKTIVATEGTNITNINVSNLPKGTYLVSTLIDNEKQVAKFTK